jgi:hypothetical protein
MHAEILLDTSTLKTVNWSVNDVDIAIINHQSGLLTAVSNSTVTVTAGTLEYGSTVKGTMKITISGQPGEAIETSGSSTINLYPNPADTSWFIIDGMKEAKQINIFDINGYMVMNIDPMSCASIEVQLDSPLGIYIIQVVEKQQTTYRKIIIN